MSGAIFPRGAPTARQRSFVSLQGADGRRPCAMGFLALDPGSDWFSRPARGATRPSPDKSWSEWTRLESVSHHDQEGQGKAGPGTQKRLSSYRVRACPRSVVCAARGARPTMCRHNRRRSCHRGLSCGRLQRARRIGRGRSGGQPAILPLAAPASHSSVLKAALKVEIRQRRTHLSTLVSGRNVAGVAPWAGLGSAQQTRNMIGTPGPERPLLDSVCGFLTRKWTPKDHARDFTFDSAAFLVDNHPACGGWTCRPSCHG